VLGVHASRREAIVLSVSYIYAYFMPSLSHNLAIDVEALFLPLKLAAREAMYKSHTATGNLLESALLYESKPYCDTSGIRTRRVAFNAAMTSMTFIP